MKSEDKVNLGYELQKLPKALIVKNGAGKSQSDLTPIMWKFFYTFLSQIKPVGNETASIEDRTVDFPLKSSVLL